MPWGAKAGELRVERMSQERTCGGGGRGTGKEVLGCGQSAPQCEGRGQGQEAMGPGPGRGLDSATSRGERTWLGRAPGATRGPVAPTEEGRPARVSTPAV